jgi:hypothetical protein
MRPVFAVTGASASLLKTQPPQLLIRAEGLVVSAGWTEPTLKLRDKNELSADGVLDLDFVARPPNKPSGDVMRPVAADFLWTKDADDVRAVIIYARANRTFVPLVGGWNEGVAAALSAKTPVSGAGFIKRAPQIDDPLECRIVIAAVSDATVTAYREEKKLKIGDSDSPSGIEAHANAASWAAFFCDEIKPRLDAKDPSYGKATCDRDLLEGLYTKTFGDIYEAWANRIRKANGRAPC